MDRTEFDTKTVIFAAGASPKKLGISGESEFIGKGVSYCTLCDGAFFGGKAVAVIGGGDTALSDALYLSKLVEKVYLIHRRDTFRAGKALVYQALSTDNIIPVYNTVPVEIIGDKAVTAVKALQNGEEGFDAAVKILEALNIDWKNTGFIHTSHDK